MKILKVDKFENAIFESDIFEVNNYIVRSYRDVIVVTNTVKRRTSKTEYSHVLKHKKHY